MNKTTMCMAAVFLLTGAAPHAEDMPGGMPGLYKAARFEWKHVDEYMSAREYRESSRHNQRAFGNAARTVFEETLTSFGVSKMGADITGAAVGLAMQGAKLDLNESETLSLAVDDVVTDDRSIYFNLKLDW